MNNKKVKELNPMFREVVDDLFQDINENSIIKSWRNPFSKSKTDIFIKINNEIKNISIKKGIRNSVHMESINTFEKYLKEMGINNEVIKLYKNYHYGIDKNNPNIILSAKEYKEKYQSEIDIINKELKKIDYLKIIDRFIISGRVSNKRIDGIIYGTQDEFLWINKDDIKNIIKSSLNEKSTGVHIGCLFIQPLNRCLNNNPKYLEYRDYIQVKWYSLFDDIIRYKNTSSIKKVN